MPIRSLLTAGLVWLLVALSPGSAEARKKAPPPPDPATLAETTVLSQCANTESEDIAVATEALSELGSVWVTVSAALDETGDLSLLYWRGVLAQCVAQDARALADFRRFLGEREGSNVSPFLVADVEQRVAGLEAKYAPPPKKGLPDRLVLPVVAVASLGGGSILLGLGSGGAWDASQQQAAALYGGTHIGSGIEPYFGDGESAAHGSRFLGVASLLSGAAAGVTAVLLFLRPQDRKRPGLNMVPIASPRTDGFSMQVVGRW